MKDFIYTFQVKGHVPDGVTPEDDAARIGAEISRESGYCLELVRVDPMPKVEGIKMEGK